MSTECDVQETLQILDPEGTVVETLGNRPLEDGIEPLIIAQQYVDVVFVNGPYPSYNFDELEVQNFNDNPPLSLHIGPIVYQDENGFRLMFNASPDSVYYALRWRITI